MLQVSAIVITYNEEADIARALKSVAWCDEIVVVDSGSTDHTLEICQAHGCKVFQREFRGYGDQKAFAVSQTSNNWVLVIDADEEVTPTLRDEIRARLEIAGDCRGFRIPITTLLWDQVLRTDPRHTGLKLRLFDRRYGNFGAQLVHESVSLNGRTELLRERMYNHSYANISDYFDKFNRYTSAAAVQMFQQGKSCSVASAVIRIPATFFQLLIIKGYIRDGAVGVMWSLFSAFYPAVKYLKLWELRRTAARVESPADRVMRPRQALGRSNVLSEKPVQNTAPDAIQGATALRRESHGLLFAFGSSLAVLAAALLWKPLLGTEATALYAVFLLAVFAAACLIGSAAALVTTALSVLALDYFAIAPYGEFSTITRLEDMFGLILFIALALITISVAYRVRRRSIR